MQQADRHVHEERIEAPGEQAAADERKQFPDHGLERPGRTVEDEDLIDDERKENGGDPRDRVREHDVEPVGLKPRHQEIDDVIHDRRQDAGNNIADEFVIKELPEDPVTGQIPEKFPGRDPANEPGRKDAFLHVILSSFGEKPLYFYSEIAYNRIDCRCRTYFR